jgi:glyoxylase I family protein
MNQHILGIRHLGVYTEDLKKSEEFYVNMLGLDLIEKKEIKRNDMEVTILFFQVGSDFIEVSLHVINSKLKEVKNEPGPISHFSIYVDDIEAYVAELKGKGAMIEGNPHLASVTKNGMIFTYIIGPSGEKIEICQTL